MKKVTQKQAWILRFKGRLLQKTGDAWAVKALNEAGEAAWQNREADMTPEEQADEEVNAMVN